MKFSGYRRHKRVSPWREISLMLILLCRSVAPALSLTNAISNWHLRRMLAEPPRRRVLQRERLFELIG